jgi:uncharacterized lipoprotein YddW (UPF0748 family)
MAYIWTITFTHIPVRGQVINDADAYAEYGGDFDNVKDWRRDNVDKLIHMLADSIHKYKPTMKFGISPLAYGPTKASTRMVLKQHGGSSYIENFADTRKWMQEGWIDYINPQMYWHIGYRLALLKNCLIGGAITLITGICM